MFDLRPPPRSVIGCLFALAVAAASDPATAQMPETPLPAWMPSAAVQMCSVIRNGDATGPHNLEGLMDMRVTASRIELATAEVFRGRYESGDNFHVTVTAFSPASENQRTVVAGYRTADDQRDPIFILTSGPDCTIATARAIARGDGMDRSVVRFSGPNVTLDGVEPLNPLIPDGVDPGGVRVAYVGSGVAYDLPEISTRLARDAQGVALGHDFKDADDRPYDRDPTQPTLLASQNGTGVASLLLAEGPSASLIPFRFAAGAAEPEELVNGAASRGARLFMMTQDLGPNFDWAAFADAVAAQPDMLFLISAGNDGANLDAIGEDGRARLDAPNTMVVTSVEPDGHLSRLGNWGMESVDVAVPAERIGVRLAGGGEGLSTGAAYAVARVAAMAVRLLEDEPSLSAADLKDDILERAAPLPNGETRLTRRGWIEDPAG